MIVAIQMTKKYTSPSDKKEKENTNDAKHPLSLFYPGATK
jgi:hypothetical protein